jgi:hypothetical protein
MTILHDDDFVAGATIQDRWNFGEGFTDEAKIVNMDRLTSYSWYQKEGSPPQAWFVDTLGYGQRPIKCGIVSAGAHHLSV